MQDVWLNGLPGGLLIGISAAIYSLADGRTAGISGIVEPLASKSEAADRRRNTLFAVAMVAGMALRRA